MNPFNVLSPLLEVLGDLAPKPRTFVIDMHDAHGADYFQECYSMVPPGMTDDEAVTSLIHPFITQGRIIDAVSELLGGYTYAEVDALWNEDRIEARKYIKWLFMSPEYLRGR